MGINRILVCDDNEFVIEIISVIILDVPNTILEIAMDGQEAIEKIRANSYNLIIMDINMPFFSGLELIRELREVSNDSDTPIIVLSGIVNEKLESKLRVFGITDVIPKPFVPNDLIACINKLIGNETTRLCK